MSSPTSPVRYRQGIPVYRYDPAPGVPPVHVFGLDAEHLPGGGIRHIHEFPVIMTDGDSAWVLRPGTVIDPATVEHAPGCIAIPFEPSVVDARLLGLMRPDPAGGVVRVNIPPADRDAWRHTVRQIEVEAERRGDGYRDALVAHLTVLLIQLNRLAAASADLPEAPLQAVFTAIEDGFRGPLALADVAKTVGLTPGYLTTWVRKRTGKTVQEWIIERKLVEARRLLAESDLPVASVARAVGFTDPAYFTRMFTREVGMSPRRWRAGLPSAPGG
jgi:AraC family transcriptional activator of pobA